MHTHKTETATFHYNSEFTGDILIIGENDDGKTQSLVVNAQDLLRFVAYCYIQPQRISEIESSFYQQLLKGA